jgi:hypothetical protein
MAGPNRRCRQGSRYVEAARMSSTLGLMSSRMASPTPTLKECPPRGLSTRGPRAGRARLRSRRRRALRRAARRSHRRRRQVPHRRGRRRARGRGDRASAPPAGYPKHAAPRPARRRRRSGLRHRRRHHPTRIQVSGERATPGFDLLDTRAVLVKQPYAHPPRTPDLHTPPTRRVTTIRRRRAHRRDRTIPP